MAVFMAAIFICAERLMFAELNRLSENTPIFDLGVGCRPIRDAQHLVWDFYTV